MKITLRRTLALTLGSLALTIGLGVPSAAPAQAAESCTSITSIRGDAAGRTYTDFEGFQQHEITFSNVSLRTPGGCSSSSWRYVLTAGYSGGGESVRSNSHFFSRYTMTTSVGFPAVSIPTPGGSGRMTLSVQPQRYNSTYGFWVNAAAASDFYVEVPGSFDSSTGSGMGSGGSCSSGGPIVGTAKWC